MSHLKVFLKMKHYLVWIFHTSWEILVQVIRFLTNLVNLMPITLGGCTTLIC